MKLALLSAFLAATSIVPVYAQSSTATGVGVGVAKSTSKSEAVAIAGSNRINANPRVTVNNVSNVPSEQTIKNVPTAFAPGLAAAGLETCLGSVSGGGSFVGTGFSFGSTVPDPGCAARLDARTLWAMGLKKAALVRLCLQTEIYRSMPDVCAAYMPRVAPTGYPVPVVVPANYAETGYVSGDIWLVDGNTGKDRLCKNYDAPGQRCRVWAHTASLHRKTTVVSTTTASPPVSASVETEPKKEIAQ